jgi:superfamily I DNA and RNA helicase
VHGYEVPGDQPRIAARLIKGLLQQGLTYDDIVILSCRGVGHSVFSDQEKVGNVKLRRFTGEYDLFGHQVLTDGRLTFDSVYRFKGQEAAAVILVDVDPDPEKLDRAWRLLYCGMFFSAVS